MKCPRCRFNFPPNWRHSGPLGTLETPGAALALILVSIAVGVLLHSFDSLVFAYVCFTLAAFLTVPWIHYFRHCRLCHCPNCSKKQRVYPWSM